MIITTTTTTKTKTKQKQQQQQQKFMHRDTTDMEHKMCYHNGNNWGHHNSGKGLKMGTVYHKNIQ